MYFLNSWYNCIFDGHCSLKLSSSSPRQSFYRTNVLYHWLVRGVTQNKRNSKCLLWAVSNKEKQLHYRYKCVYHNLICFLYLNDILTTTKLHSFGEWEWEVTNLRMKLLRYVYILWHFLGICLFNIQESQYMNRLRCNYGQNSNSKPIKY
jgi:hypothetical protein